MSVLPGPSTQKPAALKLTVFTVSPALSPKSVNPFLMLSLDAKHTFLIVVVGGEGAELVEDEAKMLLLSPRAAERF